MRRSASLPDGELPNGCRPRIRGLSSRCFDALYVIDRAQDAAGGELVRMPPQTPGAYRSVQALESRGLVSVGSPGPDWPRDFMLGVTPGGDRALERVGL